MQVVIPEVHKSDIRQPVASRHTSYSLSQTNDSIVNGVGSRRPGTETKATQQPFGGESNNLICGKKI